MNEVFYSEDNYNLFIITRSIYYEILEVITEFLDSGIKISEVESYSCTIKQFILTFERTKVRTKIIYDLMTHEFSGLFYMSLEDRDPRNMTRDEKFILKKEVLAWIYENIG